MNITQLDKNFIICENSGSTERFNYLDRKGETSKPTILYLGTWNRKLKSGITRDYVCGINLNYLDQQKLVALRRNLDKILKPTTLKGKYNVGNELLPHIFNGKNASYRTYDESRISRSIEGRLLALKVEKEDEEIAKKLASEDGYEFDEIKDDDTKKQYIEQAIRKRADEEYERQEQAEKDKKIIEPEEKEPKLEPPKPLPKPTTKPLVKPPTPIKQPTPKQPPKTMVKPTPGPGIQYQLPIKPSKIEIEKAQPPEKSKNQVDNKTKNPLDTENENQ